MRTNEQRQRKLITFFRGNYLLQIKSRPTFPSPLQPRLPQPSSTDLDGWGGPAGGAATLPPQHRPSGSVYCVCFQYLFSLSLLWCTAGREVFSLPSTHTVHAGLTSCPCYFREKCLLHLLLCLFYSLFSGAAREGKCFLP